VHVFEVWKLSTIYCVLPKALYKKFKPKVNIIFFTKILLWTLKMSHHKILLKPPNVLHQHYLISSY
jgi:hypothetical protein